jgi:hypothetical protein
MLFCIFIGLESAAVCATGLILLRLVSALAFDAFLKDNELIDWLLTVYLLNLILVAVYLARATLLNYKTSAFFLI